MDELYQSRILELARLARQGVDISHPTHHAKMNNPTCGDSVDMTAIINDGDVSYINVDVEGCALCEAGAGLLLQMAEVYSVSEIKEWHQRLDKFLNDNASEDVYEPLAPFTPIKAVKNRHKCVKLSFAAFDKMT